LDEREHWFSDEQEIRDRYWHPGPGQVVLDVGCHIGSYTIPALTAGATVYAVDPSGPRLARLREYWDGDPARLTTIDRALAEKGGYTPEFRAALDVSDYKDFHAPASARFSTLDELAAEYGLTRLDWVKIDVEGAELGVLTGGAGTIARFRPVLLIEGHDRVYEFIAAMGSERKCHDLLAGLGYEIEVAPYTPAVGPAARDFWVCRPGAGNR
jgi:FkbM family methyltransferase